ncbi:MAG TPA: ATP synthase F1 subunit delta [bacterium]|jgi:F-type H+-transporting ATPase subunit delta
MHTESAQLYAGVLLDLADAAGATDRVAGEVQDVAGLFAATPGLDRFFASPVQRVEPKRQVLGQIVDGLGVSDLTRRFLGVLLDNRRFQLMPAIAATFRERLDTRRGILRVQVESARGLSQAEVATIAARLGTRLGKSVDVEVAARPELIGGLVAHVASEEIDGSVRGKLRGLRTALLQGVQAAS